MLMPAKCPACSEEFQLDSGYLGCVRKCPECGEKFTFGGDSNAEPTRIACPQCLRDFPVKEIFANAERIPCSFCGHMMDLNEGIDALGTVQEATRMSREMLLSGASPEDTVQAIAKLGLAADVAENHVDNEGVRLPFLRYEHRSNGNDVNCAPPGECDLCGNPISGELQRNCHVIRWHCQFKSDDGYDAGPVPIFFRSGAYIAARLVAHLVVKLMFRSAGSNRLKDNEMQGIYFLCRGCAGAMKAKFFGKYKGHPVDRGYRLASHVVERW